MAVTYQLCGGDDGTKLVVTPDGELVLAFAQDNAASVVVKTFNPACGDNGSSSGWAVGWRVWIGGQMITGNAYYSQGVSSDAHTSTSGYSGTITTQAPTIVVQLQLRAWHGNEVDQDGEPLGVNDVSWAVTIGGQTESQDFATGTQTTGHWDDGASYVQVVGTYNFAQGTWSLMTSSVTPQQQQP